LINYVLSWLCFEHLDLATWMGILNIKLLFIALTITSLTLLIIFIFLLTFQEWDSPDIPKPILASSPEISMLTKFFPFLRAYNDDISNIIDDKKDASNKTFNVQHSGLGKEEPELDLVRLGKS